MSDTHKPDPIVFYETLATDINNKLQHDQPTREAIARIAGLIAKTGMSIDDCALLAKISPHRLSELSSTIPEIPIYFKLKRAEYKEKLLDVLNAQATENKDVKIAMFLLGTNFSDEYDPATKKEVAKKSSKKAESDMEKLIERVRKYAPASPVIEKDHIRDEESDFNDLSELHSLMKP